MKNVLKVEKELFLKIFLYGLSFFLLFSVITEIFTRLFGYLSLKATAYSMLTKIATLPTEQVVAPAEGLYGLIVTMFIVIALFIVVQLYNYSFFENLIWNTISKKKTTFKNTTKFLGLTILLLIIFAIIAAILFLILTKLPAPSTIVGVYIFYLILLFMGYILYVAYFSFAKTHEIFRSIKNTYVVGIKRLDLTIIPILFILVIGILLNFLLLLFASLPVFINTIMQSIVFAAYLAWFRIYLSDALKAVKL